MRLTSLVLVSFFIALGCKKMERGHQSEIKYPAGISEAGSAVLFAPGLISSDSIEHSSPSFSPDGKRVLWSVMHMPNYKATILEMTYDDGEWSAPQVVSFADTSASDIYPTFSHDGNTVYFSSSRRLPWGKFPSRGNMLWRVRLQPEGWSSVEVLDSAISRGGDYAPSLSQNGTLYYTHGPFRSPDWNINAVANMSTSPKVLPVSEINSPGYEDGAFIAHDNSYLIFESDRAGGIGGSIDLWIAFRLDNNKWNTPINMGPKVNTESTERFGKVSPDGKYLFFGSDRRKVNGKPNLDIYCIDAAVIDELRKSAFAIR